MFNPAEVVPEFICDIGTKKGEKIDYAIMRDGVVQMLIEAKQIGTPLTLENAGQLVRYFHVSNARIGVLTNGQYWNFYTDLDKPNIMDEKPFLRLNLLDVDPYTLPELKKLTKSAFDLESVLVAAEELKYVSAVKAEIAKEFTEPGEDFVRLFATRVYEGSLTAKMREFFLGITRKAVTQFVNDRVNERLKSALGSQGAVVGAAPVTGPTPQPEVDTGEENSEGNGEGSRGIETTVEEVEAYNIVRAIVVSEVSLERIAGRDTKSHFSVLFDNTNRKPICRFRFNARQKYLGLIDGEKNEVKVPIENVEQIYDHMDAIRATVHAYLG
ncbi:type I restriction enzyme HsdR N-terminal domain-containing protein [Raineyella sp. LH-20]|uniref:type I restriction enzyme HsdR N-terminal domain-containing protein n=1 Tax=Raineyella sp. LH-20 TaxID=3081204 RepID=UPI002954620A|nr:type I restriction enzyme HsdR N-terminal domain-containing protein [Raineyella sp. LH-20]WOP19061.1 type I restriction enzyme HsdR N-terminal domain-containing protein [Raineyella sp. LH-20]